MAVHRYWRLWCYAPTGYNAIGEVEMRAAEGGADQLSGGTPSASSVYQAGYEADHACDGDTGTTWISESVITSSWWQYDFGAGNELEIVEIAMIPRVAVYTQNMGSFILKFSDDGIIWSNCMGWVTTWPNANQQTFNSSNAVFLGGNGFLIVSPSLRYGNTDSSYAGGLMALKVLCPGTSNQQVTEIGAYLHANSTCHFGIFSHDAVNNCPNTLIADSDSGEAAYNSGTYIKVSFTYSSKPQLTAGSIYWLCCFPDSSPTTYLSRFTYGSNGDREGSGTYPTWPNNASWQGASLTGYDQGIYAVIEDAPVAPVGPTQAQLMRHGTWFGSGVKQRMWWAK